MPLDARSDDVSSAAVQLPKACRPHAGAWSAQSEGRSGAAPGPPCRPEGLQVKLMRMLPCQPPRSCLQAHVRRGKFPAGGLCGAAAAGLGEFCSHVNHKQHIQACLIVTPRPWIAGKQTSPEPVCRNPVHLIGAWDLLCDRPVWCQGAMVYCNGAGSAPRAAAPGTSRLCRYGSA